MMLVADLPALVQPFAHPTAIDLQSRRFVNVADGIHASDAVTVRQMLRLIEPLLPVPDPLPTGGALVVNGAAVRIGPYATRGSAIPNRGRFFLASDRNYVMWVSTGAVWQYVAGVQSGTLSPDQKPTLTTDDAGYRFYSTDFDREYRWSGSAWADSPGQEKRGQIAFFPITIHADFTPGTGWQLCDGTAGVTRSTPTGGTTTVTVPDLTTSNRFLRSVSGATGGTGGAATTHTHSVNPPNTTSGGPSTNTTGNNSASQEVQSGTGVTVAANTHTHDMGNHTHDVDIASFTSGAPTTADDALPPYYNSRPYVRL